MKWILTVAVVYLGGFAAARAQVVTRVPSPVEGASPTTVEHILVHAPSVDGNLEGNAANREVLIILPPTYRRDPQRRYPVVYGLHGYSIGAEQWSREIHVPQTVEGAFAQGSREFIVVLPDSKTVHNGSMYSRSITTGDFESFIAVDLVNYVDSHYRTIASRLSRGLVGHSMGGYGATRIGMKYPQTFGALYIMSPCCLSPRQPEDMKASDFAALEAVKVPAESAGLPFGQRALLATAAAWSPDPLRPPLYLDLPVVGGVLQPDVLAKWAANAPLAFFDQYAGNLRQFSGIAIDVGDQDSLRTDTTLLHNALDRYHIVHQFEIYSGTHVSEVAIRFQDHVMPFFSEKLRFDAPGSYASCTHLSLPHGQRAAAGGCLSQRRSGSRA
jgi:enterochelin esterase-like enzyme